jgi:hypothetical protein
MSSEAKSRYTESQITSEVTFTVFFDHQGRKFNAVKEVDSKSGPFRAFKSRLFVVCNLRSLDRVVLDERTCPALHIR